MPRRYIALIVLFLILIVVSGAVLMFAPQTSSVQIGNNVQQVACLQDDQGNCLVMPAVSGINIDNQVVSFPDAFTEDYYLVVMPFDDDQQSAARDWLPLFQAFAAEYESLHYFSIAALPDLNAGVRLLVIGGISIGVREAEVRSQIAVLFLDDQQAFLDALAIDSIDAMQIFIVDHEGVVFYRDSGDFTAEKGALLGDKLVSLITGS